MAAIDPLRVHSRQESMRHGILAIQAAQYEKALTLLLTVGQDSGAPAAMRADAFSNASVCQIRRKQWQAAKNLAQQALALDPHHVDAWCNLGGTCRALSLHLDALQAYRKACTLRPQRLDSWYARASIAQSLFLYDEAIEAWTLLWHRTQDPKAFFGRIDAYVQSGRAPLVVHETEAYLRTNPQDDRAKYLHGLVLSDLQRTEEAWPLVKDLRGNSAYDQLFVWIALQTGHHELISDRLRTLPVSARTWWLRIHSATPEELPQAVVQLREWLKYPKDENPNDLAGLHFALGRIADKAQEYESAWEHYQAGHRLLAQIQPFPQNTRTLLNDWLEKKAWKKIKPVTGASPKWLFIVGMPRSGTSLLEQILDSHPSFVGAGERHEAQALAQGFFADQDALAAEEQARKFLQLGIRLAPDSAWIIDKMPMNYRYAELILHLFPESRVLWCVRDPLDNCVSIWRQHFRGLHPYAHDWETLQETCLWQEEYRKHCEDRNPERMRTVRYESLVADLQAVIEPILHFLGEPWDASCANFFRNPRKIITASREQVQKPLYRDAVGSAQRYPYPRFGPLFLDSSMQCEREGRGAC